MDLLSHFVKRRDPHAHETAFHALVHDLDATQARHVAVSATDAVVAALTVAARGIARQPRAQQARLLDQSTRYLTHLVVTLGLLRDVTEPPDAAV